MNIFVISTGKPDKKFSVIIDNYIKKCSNFYKIQHKPTREVKIKNSSSKKREEEKLILKNINTSGFICTLDERGKAFNTHKFSNFINTRVISNQDLYFIIGGAYGLSEGIKQKAHQSIRLSDMVMQHDIALTVLLEQIYRSFTTLKGLPYHK